MDALFFWGLAGIAVAAPVLVIGQRNPMYSVLLLIVSFGALAGLYVLTGSLWAPMVLHAFVDMNSGFVGRKAMSHATA